MNNDSKLVHEIGVTKGVINMLELWLNKDKEAEVVRDYISIVEPSGRTGYKKILFKNLNPEKIRKVETITKNLMNLDATDSESNEYLENYEDFENCTNSTRHED